MIKKIPIFENGNILRKEMMMELSKFSFLLPELLFESYGDGIISGCKITTNRKEIIVDKGVIYFKGQLFLIDEPCFLLHSPTNRMSYLKFLYLAQKVNKSFVEHRTEIVIEDKPPKENEIELCRFKLQQGARLRYEYDDFEDMCTEFDTINIIYSPYAAKGKSSINPEILNGFAKEMIKLKPDNLADISFCMQVLGSYTGVRVDMVVSYIYLKTGEDLDRRENIYLYRKLLEILNIEKTKAKGQEPKKAMKKQVILVD